MGILADHESLVEADPRWNARAKLVMYARIWGTTRIWSEIRKWVLRVTLRLVVRL
jgi:hypothetical protein